MKWISIKVSDIWPPVQKKAKLFSWSKTKPPSRKNWTNGALFLGNDNDENNDESNNNSTGKDSDDNNDTDGYNNSDSYNNNKEYKTLARKKSPFPWKPSQVEIVEAMLCLPA